MNLGGILYSRVKDAISHIVLELNTFLILTSSHIFIFHKKKKNDWQSIENDYETNACIDWWQKSSDALLDIYKNTIYKLLLQSERKIFFTYHKSPINRHYKIKFSAQWLSISLCTYIQYFIYFYWYWLDIFCFCCCSFTIWYCTLDTRWDS